MRKIWVKVDPWDKKMVTTALEGGADGVLVPPGYADTVRQLGRIDTIAEDGDWKLGEDVVFFEINSSEDEEEIIRLAREKKVILQCPDWTIIPLENLIARGAEVIAQVNDAEAARTAFGILEKGVGHILLAPPGPAALKQALAAVRESAMETALQTAVITAIIPVGMGDRVCVDTCTAMTQGQGMLVGNSSSALFLIHSESVVNPYVSPRPFRINAGPVHAYTRVPGGKTRYLSELAAGDAIYVTDFQGRVTESVVGRLKIEKRPLMLVTAEADGREVTTIVQNAETIRLVDPDGKPVSVVQLKPEDQVLVSLESGGRHFGYRIEETITEK
ncbi:MAG: 3-dehydroquinate synthase II [Desulfosudaceae bacterium]